MLKIAHISDLHFATKTYHPKQFLSKQWIGNFNLIFSRSKTHSEKQVWNLIPFFLENNIDIVLISGDLSTTSRREEFTKACAFIEALREKGIKTLVIPGNHDQYTKKSYQKQIFYDYFTNDAFAPLFKDTANCLKTEKITAVALNNQWCCVLLDTAIATSFFMSSGLFSSSLEEKLIDVLKRIPKDMNILLMNHFPFFCIDSVRKRLKRRKELRQILEQYPVHIYINGHTHNQSIANLNPDLPLIMDSGSCSEIKHGSFHMLTLENNTVSASVQCIDQGQWATRSNLVVELNRSIERG